MKEIADFCVDGPFNENHSLIFRGAELSLIGWAILPNSSYRLAVYSDDLLLGCIIPSEARADVLKVFFWLPRDAVPGFNTALTLPKGLVEQRPDLRIRVAIEHNGKVLKESSWPIAKEAPKLELHIDNARNSEGKIICDQLNTRLTGWTDCEEMIDGITAHFGTNISVEADYGISRFDALTGRFTNPLDATGFSVFIPIVPSECEDLLFSIRLKTGEIVTRRFEVIVDVERAVLSQFRSLPSAESKILARCIGPESRPCFLILPRKHSFSFDATGDVGEDSLTTSSVASIMAAAVHGIRPTILIHAGCSSDSLTRGIFQNGQELSAALQDSRNEWLIWLQEGDTISDSLCLLLSDVERADKEFTYWDEIAEIGDNVRRVYKVPGAPLITLLHHNFIGRGWATRVSDGLLNGLAHGDLNQILKSTPLAAFQTPNTCSFIPEALSKHVYEDDFSISGPPDVVVCNTALADIGSLFGMISFVTSPAAKPRETSQFASSMLICEEAALPSVSVIISVDGTTERLEDCLRGLREFTDYPNLEIVLVGNVQFAQKFKKILRRLGDPTDHFLPIDGPFNWARFNNLGAEQASGDVLLFMNLDVQVENPQWLRRLIPYICLQSVGAVGPRLLTKLHTVKSCGMSIIPGSPNAFNDYCFTSATISIGGGLNVLPHNCSALLDTMIITRREVFTTIGGFEEELHRTSSNLRFHSALQVSNLQIAVISTVSVTDFGQPSWTVGGFDPTIELADDKGNPEHLLVDPYIHPAFETESGMYRVALEYRWGDKDRIIHPVIDDGRGNFPSITMSCLYEGAKPISFEDQQRFIHICCDNAWVSIDGTLRAEGWAVASVGVDKISVHLNDRFLGFAELGILRADVGAEFSSVPEARLSGFRFESISSVGPQYIGARMGELTLIVVNRFGDRRLQTVELKEAEEDSKEFVAFSDEFSFNLDTPAVSDDRAIKSSVGPLAITGWVFAKSGVLAVEILIDAISIGSAHYGIVRRDVAAAFPGSPNALRSGFSIQCPSRTLQPGTRDIELRVRATNGNIFSKNFLIDISNSKEYARGPSIRRRVDRTEREFYHDLVTGLDRRIQFHLVLDLRSACEKGLVITTLQSIRHQCCDDWKLTLMVNNEKEKKFSKDLASEFGLDFFAKIHIQTAKQLANRGLDLNGNPEDTIFVGLFKPGDELGSDALMCFAVAAAMHPRVDLLYADEIARNPANGKHEAFFKPDYSPDLLISTNYLGCSLLFDSRLLALMGKDIITSVRGEFDLSLRSTELATEIHHIPRLLFARGERPADTDAQQQEALESAIVRRGIRAQILPGEVTGSWRVKRAISDIGTVSIIIPTCGTGGYIVKCIESLRAVTIYRDFEIICVDNIPDTLPDVKDWVARNADKIISLPGDFNWSAFNNVAETYATGAFLLFLNDDTEFVQGTWLDALLEHAQRTEVGIVGSRLLYPDGRVQHAGMFLSSIAVARHAFRFAPAESPGYFGLARIERNVLAVTGACMLMRRSVFHLLGGFDERHSAVNNDLDFCLRSFEKGLLTVYTPHSLVIHHELASRHILPDTYDIQSFIARWDSVFPYGDPYFNPNLSKLSDDFEFEHEMTQSIFSTYPLFYREDIKTILVVKLDHIGDFIVSIPALKQLRKLFASAKIYFLGGASVKNLAVSSGVIDSFIEFDFFHSRSALGRKKISPEFIEVLTAELAQYEFDLAIDLRKHPDTREVLRYTGARYLAGFDHMGAFPFLDISVEWEADAPLQSKRSNIVADLMLLVDTLAIASEAEPPELNNFSANIGTLNRNVQRALKRLRDRPVVVIHPGVGNPMRQWPVKHFVKLINLLVERKNVNIMLIGSADEASISDAIISQVTYKRAVTSFAGSIKLDELPDVLRGCVLYVGNDSGPKHLAAMLGVPTIGIHSGVVDPVEWAPVGRRAVAIQRNTTCSPCYIEREEDCVRNLACLQQLEPESVWEFVDLLLSNRAEGA